MYKLNGNKCINPKHKISHKVVHLLNFNNIGNISMDVFSDVEKLFVSNCNKCFVNKFITRKTFPKIKELYLCYDFEKPKYLNNICKGFIDVDKIYVVNSSNKYINNNKIKIITPYDFCNATYRYPTTEYANE